jgi:predicted enzyme related to lactoylglutathione lyase
MARVVHFEIHADDPAQDGPDRDGWQGYFIDTEGNTFGIHQPDPEAR